MQFNVELSELAETQYENSIIKIIVGHPVKKVSFCNIYTITNPISKALTITTADITFSKR